MQERTDLRQRPLAWLPSRARKQLLRGWTLLGAGSPGPLLPAHFAGSFAIVGVALAIALLLQQFLAVTNIGLVFITAVLASAVAYGLWPSLFACLLSVLVLNFFFLPPLYTFTIASTDDVAALFFFLLVAVIASYLSAHTRSQAVAARDKAADIENLYLFSRKLAGAFTLDDLLWAISFQFATMLKVRVVILLPEAGDLAVRAGYPPEDRLDAGEMAAARSVWSGAAEDVSGTHRRMFLPMRTGRGTIGIVGLDSDGEGHLLSIEQRRLFDALSDQAALAIERINLAHDIERERFAAETERLRSALLTSISHDLRTPLASILGSASSLRSQFAVLDENSRAELIGTIEEEAERLNRFIANLLDMTRLESGAVAPRLEPVDLGDVVGSALRRAAAVLARHRIEVDLPADLPMPRLDPVLFEQVVFNLLDNAGKYAPPETTITIAARAENNTVSLSVADEGDGIPAEDRERIFDKFYRVQATDRKRAGTGLGLAICRGFVEAMGGTIGVSNRSDRSGALFAIALPLPAEGGPTP